MHLSASCWEFQPAKGAGEGLGLHLRGGGEGGEGGGGGGGGGEGGGVDAGEGLGGALQWMEHLPHTVDGRQPAFHHPPV